MTTTALTINESVDRYNSLVEFVKTVMKRDVDFGVIPGTNKPTLLKPGAEKLCSLFNLAVKYSITDKVLNWGDDGSEPLFYFEYKCELFRGDQPVSEGDGSCNSREKKYRYRNAARICPNCEKDTIIKGRAEYGGGWLCFRKKGGCGEKYEDNDPQIVSQDVGQILNPDIADLVNTIQKMSQKRALIAAVLIAANASEFFTQDIEDMDIIDGQFRTRPTETTEDKQQSEQGADIESNGKRPGSKGATVAMDAKTWRTVADSFAKANPHYLDSSKEKGNYFHILRAAYAEGHDKVTEKNVRAVLEQVAQRQAIESDVETRID